MQPVNSLPVPTRTIFLLDRNVVALIKDAAVDGKQRDAKKQAYLDWLRTLDRPENGFSPLLSIMEGEKGYADNAVDKAACLETEAGAVGRFFTHASTDAAQLRLFADGVATMLSGLQESQWGNRVVFFTSAAPLVVQKVAQRERRGVEDKLIQLAAGSGLATDDAIVMLLLACLYGSDAARRVLKPARPNAYNVLSDLHVISRVGLIKAVAQQSPVPVRVRFLTLDEGLFGILDHIGIVRPQLTATGGLAMQIRYSPALFPALSAADAVALLRRHVRTEP
ncbi:hypothetical protein [Paraburkholderia gardini]|uniref:hypothetical protein n=1 Tax=Paraburkholderia gardini TaxID=2823469 RepID=UPI001D316E7C|nr:hypothetical protein [Paraburkholderia gardini]CAG4890898.1 hypothetical protein R69919_01063 [Paraburkholderia gardini]